MLMSWGRAIGDAFKIHTSYLRTVGSKRLKNHRSQMKNENLLCPDKCVPN
jgi:hypothetical protein